MNAGDEDCMGGLAGFPYDGLIVGGGIIGLAVAMRMLQNRGNIRVAVLEKESAFGCHQTGHNSGVLHSGIYYRPGSLKARLCIEGARRLVEFCEKTGVPYHRCGKVIVACDPSELTFLEELLRRGIANGIEGLRLLSPAEVRRFEPYVSCIRGLHVPATGVVDFQRVARAYARAIESLGGRLLPGHRVTAVDGRGEFLTIHTDRGAFRTRCMVNCAGLHSDRVARLSGLEPDCRIVPFRGEYYEIRKERAHLVNTLIYPVPDPRFPFLGVHFTRMISGKVEAGPNAVLAWAREGYTRTSFRLQDTLENLSYPGLWRLTARYWRPGLHEVLRSCSKSLFLKALQKLVPSIGRDDLIPGGSGVRAQALRKDGSLLDDFLVVRDGRSFHVLNAPSPAATSSLAIADHILQQGLLDAL